MRELARREVALTLWRWTADAVLSSSGAVKQDAYKYNTNVHTATKSAKAARAAGSAGLRHEHAVPRVVLARRIVDDDLSTEAIFELLDKFCVAVIVTAEEDRRLRPRNEMPPDWSWGDRYARYVHSNLYDELEFPSRRGDSGSGS
jgi:acetyl-CoA acetyltransferase